LVKLVVEAMRKWFLLQRRRTHCQEIANLHFLKGSDCSTRVTHYRVFVGCVFGNESVEDGCELLIGDCLSFPNFKVFVSAVARNVDKQRFVLLQLQFLFVQCASIIKPHQNVTDWRWS
jgi:hypothetical protein